LLLPVSHTRNFRERLVEYLENSSEQENENRELQVKAEQLLDFYEQVFGVNDLIETPEDAN